MSLTSCVAADSLIATIRSVPTAADCDDFCWIGSGTAYSGATNRCWSMPLELVQLKHYLGTVCLEGALSGPQPSKSWETRLPWPRQWQVCHLWRQVVLRAALAHLLVCWYSLAITCARISTLAASPQTPKGCDERWAGGLLAALHSVAHNATALP